MKPAIIVSAYNRPETLARLLKSIASSMFPDDVPFVISIDRGGNRHSEVLDIAEKFEWKFGVKEIISHKEHLGLSKHALFVGTLTNKYGSIIRLEDDYYVSPVFYEYASRALDFYKDDERIAGISLYNLWFNGITKDPFVPYFDNGDTYFVQSPWSQGQAYLSSQLDLYFSWLQQHDLTIKAADPLHESWAELDDEEWFAPVAKYLTETNRFYVFPRESLCTSFGDIGTHFKKTSRYFQVPLQSRKRNFNFQKLDDSVAVYDAFQEMMPDRLKRMSGEIGSFDFELDLSGTKKQAKIRHEYVITSQPCISPVKSWGLEMYPPELNIVENVPGTNLKLCRKENLHHGRLAKFVASFHQYEYSRARLSVGLGRHVAYWILRRILRIFDRSGNR